VRFPDGRKRRQYSFRIAEVNPDAVATVLWASWNGIISLGWRPDDLHRSAPELRELLRTATDVIARGLLTDHRRNAGPGRPETHR
jgi:hypothetical protein